MGRYMFRVKDHYGNTRTMTLEERDAAIAKNAVFDWRRIRVVA